MSSETKSNGELKDGAKGEAKDEVSPIQKQVRKELMDAFNKAIPMDTRPGIKNLTQDALILYYTKIAEFWEGVFAPLDPPAGGVPPPYPPATSSATSSISSGSASVAGAPKVGGATPVGDAIPVAAYRYQECCNAMTELVYNLKKHNNYHAVADLYCQRNGREWSLFYDDEVEASASLAEKKKLESKPYFSTAVPPKSQVASNEPKLSKTQKKNAKKRLKKSNQKVVTLPTVASSSSTT